jgi:uncharacterized protein YceH (UPF0502 family)
MAVIEDKGKPPGNQDLEARIAALESIVAALQITSADQEVRIAALEFTVGDHEARIAALESGAAPEPAGFITSPLDDFITDLTGNFIMEGS